MGLDYVVLVQIHRHFSDPVPFANLYILCYFIDSQRHQNKSESESEVAAYALSSYKISFSDFSMAIPATPETTAVDSTLMAIKIAILNIVRSICTTSSLPSNDS